MKKVFTIIMFYILLTLAFLGDVFLTIITGMLYWLIPEKKMLFPRALKFYLKFKTKKDDISSIQLSRV